MARRPLVLVALPHDTALQALGAIGGLAGSWSVRWDPTPGEGMLANADVVVAASTPPGLTRAAVVLTHRPDWPARLRATLTALASHGPDPTPEPAHCDHEPASSTERTAATRMPHLVVVVDLGEAGSAAAVLGESALQRGCRVLLVDARPHPSLPFLYDAVEPAPPPADDHPRLEVAPADSPLVEEVLDIDPLRERTALWAALSQIDLLVVAATPSDSRAQEDWGSPRATAGFLAQASGHVIATSTSLDARYRTLRAILRAPRPVAGVIAAAPRTGEAAATVAWLEAALREHYPAPAIPPLVPAPTVGELRPGLLPRGLRRSLRGLDPVLERILRQAPPLWHPPRPPRYEPALDWEVPNSLAAPCDDGRLW